MRDAEPSTFNDIKEAFRLLVSPPVPLSFDGAPIRHGWPARAIPLDELRSRLPLSSTLRGPTCRHGLLDAGQSDQREPP